MSEQTAYKSLKQLVMKIDTLRKEKKKKQKELQQQKRLLSQKEERERQEFGYEGNQLLKKTSSCNLIHSNHLSQSQLVLIYNKLFFSLEEEEYSKVDTDQVILISQFMNKKGILIMDMQERDRSQTDLRALIFQLLSKGNYQLYKLSYYLEAYQEWIKEDVKQKEKYFQYLIDNKLVKYYQDQYTKFEKWAKSTILTLDGFSYLFSFTISKFSLQTQEFTNTVSGYSSSLLNMRGININTQEFFHKRPLCFFDRETSLNLVINSLKNCVENEKIEYKSPLLKPPDGYQDNSVKKKILTYDGINILFNSTKQNCNNRSTKYPFFKESNILPSLNEPEFQLNINFYTIPEEEINRVKISRNSRGRWEKASIDNAEYYFQDCEFVNKYYNNGKGSFFPDLNYCGEICCNNIKGDEYLI